VRHFQTGASVRTSTKNWMESAQGLPQNECTAQYGNLVGNAVRSLKKYHIITLRSSEHGQISGIQGKQIHLKTTALNTTSII
jgi:hypothetical protein